MKEEIINYSNIHNSGGIVYSIGRFIGSGIFFYDGTVKVFYYINTVGRRGKGQGPCFPLPASSSSSRGTLGTSSFFFIINHKS